MGGEEETTLIDIVGKSHSTSLKPKQMGACVHIAAK